MSHRETDNDYDDIVAQLTPDCRVIICTSRDGVLRWTQNLPGREILASLPDRFKSRHKPSLTAHTVENSN